VAPLRVAAEGRWAEWDGLEPGLTDGDVAAAFAVDPSVVEHGTGRLSGRPREVRTVREGGEPVLRWWLDGVGAASIVQVVAPASRPDLEAALAALGRPEREGAGRHLVSGAMTTELVWPARGLSLTLAESYDDPPAWPRRLASALLFPASDLRTFVTDLGGNDRGGPAW
jgi:hypothetical protein